jgi:hypothetical protein
MRILYKEVVMSSHNMIRNTHVRSLVLFIWLFSSAVLFSEVIRHLATLNRRSLNDGPEINAGHLLFDYTIRIPYNPTELK